MRKGRLGKYIMWLVLVLVGGLTIPTMLLLCFGSSIADEYLRHNLSYFGLALSSIVLMFTLLIGGMLKSAYRNEEKTPVWIGVLVIYSAVGFFVGTWCGFGAFTEHGSTASTTFLVSAGIAGMIHSINVGLVFVAQTWIAIGIIRLPLFNVWPAHTLFAMWLWLVLFYPDNAAYVIISAMVVLAAVPVAILIEVLIDWRDEAMRKRLEKIYS